LSGFGPQIRFILQLGNIKFRRHEEGMNMLNRKSTIKGLSMALAIAAAACGTAYGDTFQDGEFVTWNTIALAGALAPTVEQDFDAALASSSGLMEIGIPGAAGYSIIFDSGNALEAFFPGEGPGGRLTADLLDPTQSSGGAFAAEIADLTMTTVYNRAGFIVGTSSVLLQNLTLTGLSGDEQWANGLSIGGVLAEADTVLGGGPLPNNKTSLNAVFGLVDDINYAFDGGEVDSWADQHLLLPTSGGGTGGGTTTAPEINPTGAMSGITLLLGALGVLRARIGRNARELATASIATNSFARGEVNSDRSQRIS
jgi:hypothetical protein